MGRAEKRAKELGVLFNLRVKTYVFCYTYEEILDMLQDAKMSYQPMSKEDFTRYYTGLSREFNNTYKSFVYHMRSLGKTIELLEEVKRKYYKMNLLAEKHPNWTTEQLWMLVSSL